MSSSEFEKRTSSNNYVATSFMKHPPDGRVSHIPGEAAGISAALLMFKSQDEPRKEILEPTPFREGTYLELLPHLDNIYVPMLIAGQAGSKIMSLESSVSSAIACLSGSRLYQPSENIMEYHVPFSDVSIVNEDSKPAHFSAFQAIIRDTTTMPMGAVPPENMSTITITHRSTNNTQDQKLQNSQDAVWNERFQQLLKFKAKHGHCLVPFSYPEDPRFAGWAKRQRFQYKLLMLGNDKKKKPCVMTEERSRRLESVGFVLDPFTVAWEARLLELMEFQLVHGHCNVPCRYPQNPSLGSWVKRQRRQYKKHMSGAPTNVPPDRFQILADMGFQWEILRT